MVWDGTVTGSRSMMSATVTSRISAPTDACIEAWRAAWVRNSPISTNHSPLVTSPLPPNTSATPPAMTSRPNSCPKRAQARVARFGSPVIRQTIARAIRPPSSGKAGNRLNTSSTSVDQRQPAEQHQRRGGVQPGLEQRDVEEVAEAPEGEPGEHADRDDQRVDGGSGGGQPELGARGLGLAARAGEAAQRPQVDALDRHPLMAGDERVAELVGDDRGEEQQGAQRRDDERLGPVRQDPREVAVQRVDDEKQHEQRPPADADADPEQLPELDRAGTLHSSILR